MKKGHSQDEQSGEDVKTQNKSRNDKGAKARQSSSDDVSQSLQSMYDDVVNEPVPDGMKNFDAPDQKS